MFDDPSLALRMIVVHGSPQRLSVVSQLRMMIVHGSLQRPGVVSQLLVNNL
jgi:hypothetical protein